MTLTFKAERICLVTSTFCACGALALIICSIVRSEWVQLKVHEKVARNEYLWCYHTRHRGLLLECVENSTAKVLTLRKELVRHQSCFELDLGQMAVQTSESYWSILHLRRVSLATICSGSLTNLISIVLLFLALAQLRNNKKLNSMFIKSRVVSAVFCAITFLLLIFGIVVFHATLIAEMSQHEPAIMCLWANMEPALQQGTSISYGLMYTLIWCAVGLTSITFLFIIISVSFASQRCVQLDHLGRSMPENNYGIAAETRQSLSAYDETSGTLNSQVHILRETESSLRRTIY